MAPRLEPRSVNRRCCTGTHSLFGFGMAAVFQRFILPASINTASEAQRDAGTLLLATCVRPDCPSAVQPAAPFSRSSRRVSWLIPVDSPAGDVAPTRAHDGRLGPRPDSRCVWGLQMQLAPADMDAVVVGEMGPGNHWPHLHNLSHVTSNLCFVVSAYRAVILSRLTH